MTKRNDLVGGVSRRSLLKTGAGLAGGAMLPAFPTMIFPAHAQNKPAIGTYPAGSSGDTVNIGAAVPRTGTYAVQGEDELKGMQLAVEHMNTNHPLMKKLAPKVNKPCLSSIRPSTVGSASNTAAASFASAKPGMM